MGGNSVPSARREIYILGTGVSPTQDMTPRTTAILESVDQIVSIIRAPLDCWLPTQVRTKPVHDLYALYSAERHRVENYLEAARRTISLAKLVQRTALVTPGSPSVYDRLASLVLELGNTAELRTTIVPALSSIEGLLAFLGEDMAPGLQIYEARWFLQNKVQPVIAAACLLVQPGAFATDRMPTLQDASPRKLRPLLDYLKSFYPGHQPLVFARCPSAPGDAGHLRQLVLDQLCDGGEADCQGTSLYIPSAGSMSSERWRRHRAGEQI
jgi:hypothetical protein